jgi:hypothetical protein
MDRHTIYFTHVLDFHGNFFYNEGTMKRDEYELLTKEQLVARNELCVENNLDFVTLRPLPPAEGLQLIHHAELGQEVFTLSVPVQIRKK